MVVKLIDFPKQDKHKAIKEVALEGLKGMENLIQTLSHNPSYLKGMENLIQTL